MEPAEIPKSIYLIYFAPMSLLTPYRVVIVGAGFAGTATAVALLRAWRSGPLEVTLLERSGDFGPGVAFSTPDRSHLLNVVAGGMSALPGAPDHFLDWLRERDGHAHAGSFAPRRAYGAYLRELLATAEREAATADGAVRVVRSAEPAVRVHDARDGRPAVVVTGAGRRLAGDAVVLAVGVNRPRVPSGTDPALLATAAWVGDPWDHARIAALADAERVLFLGSGLTMVDVAVTLAGGGTGEAGREGDTGGTGGGVRRTGAGGRGRRSGAGGGVQTARSGPALVALSRRGVLPRAHRSAPPPHLAPYRPPTGPLTADRLAAHVEAAALAEVAAGGDWRTVVDGVRPYTQQLWQALPLGEQARFLARHARRWEVHRHRMAPAVATTIRALRASGRLELRAGALLRLAVSSSGSGVVARYRTGDGGERIVSADAVVNCTGPDPAPGADGDPLLSALIEDRLGRAGPLGLGLDTGPDGELCDCDGRRSSRLFTLGALRRGQLWETTAVPEIRVQADELGRLLAARGTLALAEAARGARETAAADAA